MSLSKEFPGGITNGAFWYPVYGGMQDWNYIHHGCFELTLEISDNKWPNATELLAIWEYNRMSMLNIVASLVKLLAIWEYNRMSMLNIVASLVKTGIHGRIFSSDVFSISQITAGKLFADYHRLLAPREKYEVIATMPGYRTKSTCIVLGEAAATVDFVLDPETTDKGGQIVVGSNCYFENKTAVQVTEVLPTEHIEISIPLILILAFLCFLMKRRVKPNHTNQRQSVGPRRELV
ncbi:Metallocarboxypeptidase D [Handroanthus impetiginosus]|uniref:Metallocarboxypeptidase D n=1 Tax=Handroanthus impetiginosus TaxID=429701 RepID=A0A2G9HBK2_9LAMI|nr:Metallocarboxypeptidase D [Handroanthus impetiginosus]